MPKTLESFPEKRQRHEQQQNGVCESRQHARPAVPERSLGIGRALRPTRCDPGDQYGGNVRKVMDCIAHQSDGMAKIASHEFCGYKYQRCHQCRREESVGYFPMGMGFAAMMHVHKSHSTSAAQPGYLDIPFGHRTLPGRPDLGLSRSKQPQAESPL